MLQFSNTKARMVIQLEQIPEGSVARTSVTKEDNNQTSTGDTVENDIAGSMIHPSYSNHYQQKHCKMLMFSRYGLHHQLHSNTRGVLGRGRMICLCVYVPNVNSHNRTLPSNISPVNICLVSIMPMFVVC